MQPALSLFSQPPPINPNLPPTSYPQPPSLPSHSLPQTQLPIQQPIPSVPFAALSDPVIFFDGHDHTFPLKNF